MGKGTIISGGTDGQYQIKINFYRDKVNAEIAALETRIEALEWRILAMDFGTERDIAELQKTSLEKRKEFLENVIPEDETISAWCADFSEELTGDVGTIEVPGERGTVLIQPGYENNAAYSKNRDGQLLPTVGAAPMQYFYNLAMLPGWQKWKPTFRFGIITSRNGNEANVTLEETISSQQNIDVNQTTTLTNVPIEYMACNGGVFEPGDEVLIMFENQDWETPKIIGFKDNPKACYPYIVVQIDYDPYGDNISFVWDVNKNAFASNIPDGLGGFLTMPTTYNALAYWRSITTDVTESRHWTAQPFDYPYMTYPDRDGDSGSQYVEDVDNVCSNNPVTSYQSREWTFTDTPTYGPWEPDPDELPKCRINESTVTQDETDYRYLAVSDDDRGFCFDSKNNSSLDFKVNISEEITERTKDIDTYAKSQECHYPPVPPDFVIGIVITPLKYIFTFLYEETRVSTLETPVGNFELFSVSEPNSVDYEDNGSCSSIVKGDWDNTLYEHYVDYFDAPTNHSETVFCQICILQSTLKYYHSTRENYCLPLHMGIDYYLKSAAKTGDVVETSEEEIIKVVAFIGTEEDGIIDGEYDPKTGVLNEELSNAVQQIITDRGDLIHAVDLRFRM